MGFIQIPTLWETDEDADRCENLKTEVKQEMGYITINTRLICAYNSMDNGNTMVRMSNGQDFEVPIKEDEFADLLNTVESVCSLSDIHEN